MTIGTYADPFGPPKYYGQGTIAPAETPIEIERFITKMMTQQAEEDEVKAVQYLADAGWVAAEIDHWMHRCEELEIELECMRHAFPESDHDVSPKIRGNF
jgi:hypothetical protein